MIVKSAISTCCGGVVHFNVSTEDTTCELCNQYCDIAYNCRDIFPEAYYEREAALLEEFVKKEAA